MSLSLRYHGLSIMVSGTLRGRSWGPNSIQDKSSEIEMGLPSNFVGCATTVVINLHAALGLRTLKSKTIDLLRLHEVGSKSVLTEAHLRPAPTPPPWAVFILLNDPKLGGEEHAFNG